MGAAEVGVAGSSHEVGLQHAHGADVAVVSELGVPGAREAGAVAVEEDQERGQVVVVVDDVLQVDVAFPAFVPGHGEESARVVYGVYGVLPAAWSVLIGAVV